LSDLYHRSLICGSQSAVEIADRDLLERIGAPTTATLERHRMGTVHVAVGAGNDVFGTDRLLVVLRGRVRDARNNAPLAARDVAAHWERDAEKLLPHLRGRFALVVCDARREEIVLATDWLGTHSLCYATAADGRFAFASDARLLAACPGVDTELSPQGLYHYLYFHMIPSPGTVYRGVHRLEPAHVLTHGKGGTARKCYWTPRFSEELESDAATLGGELRSQLGQSVRSALDGRACASFLSGGLDSSTVTGLLAGIVPRASAYSIGFEAQGYDEMQYARIAARHFKVEHREYYVKPADVHAALPAIATAYDEPYGNSSAIPVYYCASVAERDGVRLMLAGDGGDEIFGGNARYVEQKVLGFYELLPQALRRSVCESLLLRLPSGWLPPLRKVQSYVRQAREPLPDRLERWNYFTRTAAAEILTPEFLAKVDTRAPLELLRSVYRRAPDASPLNRMLMLDWKQTLADNDLRKVNRTAALAGVDVEYPFLDPAVVELSTRVPSRLKIRGLTLRAFYKDAMRDFLPREILRKSKHGFGLPFGLWLRDHAPLRELVFDSLATLRRRGIVRGSYLDGLRDQHAQEHAAYYGEFIWILAVLELWLQRYAGRYSLT
jgi:asparagine synthase (glutamine-hydrolysing)